MASNDLKFSKIILNGTTLMDVTQDSVVANTLLSGETATRADGERIMGTLTTSGTVQDVQINGTSILQSGVANIPLGSGAAFGVFKRGPGLYDSNGVIGVNTSTDENVKNGIVGTYTTVSKQHLATFYGLAKAAGVDMASSSNSVGTYTDEAKVAIQNMLGVYQAPWELIRTDTFTNETAGQHIITVDGDGLPFELTNLIFVLVTPAQDPAAELGSYGRVYFYYGNSNQYNTAYFNAYTSDQIRTSTAIIEQSNGLRKLSYLTNTSSGGDGSPKIHANNVPSGSTDGYIVTTDEYIYNKIVIDSIKGIAKYNLFGIRKQN